jgi:hypothetical protein
VTVDEVQVVCELDMLFLMKSTIHIGFLKSVQDVSQNNNKQIVWISANNLGKFKSQPSAEKLMLGT